MLAVVFSTGKWYSNEANEGSSVVEILTNIPKIKGLIPVDLAFGLQFLPLASGKVMRQVVVAQW